MKNKYVSISKYIVNNKFKLDKLSIQSNIELQFYIREEQGKDSDSIELLSFLYFDQYNELCDIIENEQQNMELFKNDLKRDIERQILFLEDEPIDNLFNTDIKTKYIQVRTIEVVPSKYDSYRNWRENSIFKFVRKNKKIIKTFGAYHSLVSTTPGVTFISSFDDLDNHENIFNSKEYDEILVTAGRDYIIHGQESGLGLINYKRII